MLEVPNCKNLGAPKFEGNATQVLLGLTPEFSLLSLHLLVEIRSQLLHNVFVHYPLDSAQEPWPKLVHFEKLEVT